jgi:hypothetical protein
MQFIKHLHYLINNNMCRCVLFDMSQCHPVTTLQDNYKEMTKYYSYFSH